MSAFPSDILAHVDLSYSTDSKTRIYAEATSLLSIVPTLRPAISNSPHSYAPPINIPIPPPPLNSALGTRYLYLYGTIPIDFSGYRYNIPLTISLDPSFPLQPPRCLVAPTSNMAIKHKHRHVDTSGTVYLPYLSTWDQRTHSLIELVNLLISVFSLDPPVYTISAEDSTPHQSRITDEEDGRNTNTKKTLKESVYAKFRHKWGETTKLMADRIEKQRIMQQRLRCSEEQANRRLIELEELLIPLSEDKKKLEELTRNAETTIASTKEKESADCRDLVKPKDPLSQQMLDCLVLEASFEDILLRYEEEMLGGRIVLQQCLSGVREVSRELYLTKKLRSKVYEYHYDAELQSVDHWNYKRSTSDTSGN